MWNFPRVTESRSLLSNLTHPEHVPDSSTRFAITILFSLRPLRLTKRSIISGPLVPVPPISGCSVDCSNAIYRTYNGFRITYNSSTESRPINAVNFGPDLNSKFLSENVCRMPAEKLAVTFPFFASGFFPRIIRIAVCPMKQSECRTQWSFPLSC